MIPVEALPQKATAYQFLSETAEGLSKLVLPTGPVTVQFADPLNRTESRCYVMTTWGTATLNEGDWIIAYEVGVVAAVTAEQFPLFFEMRDDGLLVGFDPAFEEGRMQTRVQGDMSPARLGQFDLEALSAGGDEALSVSRASEVTADLPKPMVRPVFKARAMSDGSSWVPSFEVFCSQYRLDYSIVREENVVAGTPDFSIRVNATGRVVVHFCVGDILVGFPDGRIEVAGEDAA